MESLEKRLIFLGTQSANVPNSDEFILRLHGEIKHRQEVKQRILLTSAAVVLVVMTTIGLFENLWMRADFEYGVESEFLFLSDLDGDEIYDNASYVDESFMWEAVDYLIYEMDLLGIEWEIIQDFEDLGIMNSVETNEWEKS